MTTTTRKIAKSSIEFDSTEFEFSHGRKPSGRGSWAFCFDDKNSEPWFAFTMHPQYGKITSLTYADAKREARTEAQRRGAIFVFVCA